MNATQLTGDATTGMALGQMLKGDDMSLQDKLDAIDAAMKAAQQQADEDAVSNGGVAAPVDPASLTICDGCE